MRKLIYLLIFLSLPLALYTKSAQADIDIIRKIVDKLRESNQEEDTDITKEAVETETEKKEIKGFDKKKFEEIYKKAEKLANKVKEIISDPLGAGIKLAQRLQEKLKDDELASDEEKADVVQKMYSRTKDSSIDVAEEQQKATNLLLIENTSSLYAKALVLRQNLNDEETDAPNIETQEDALRSNTAVQLKSLERWNEILKMQSYISNYNNFLENQNYALDKEDEEEEE